MVWRSKNQRGADVTSTRPRFNPDGMSNHPESNSIINHICIHTYIYYCRHITSYYDYDILNFLQSIDVTRDFVGQNGRVDEAKLPENGALFSLFSLIWSYWRWPTSGGMGASTT